MNKKIVLIFAIILAASLFTACEETNISTIKSEDGQTEIIYSADMKESVELPINYPAEILPVYKDSFIGASSKDDHGPFVIVTFTNDSMEEIKNFYKEVLKNAEVEEENTTDDQYVNSGKINGKSYTVTVVPTEDSENYTTNINLIIEP